VLTGPRGIMIMGAAHRFSDSELESMLQDIESGLVERKESLRGDAPTGIREAVCAFANDLLDHQRPGVVFVGADDAGKPTGLPITDALLRRLADIKTDGNIVPPPTLTVGKRLLAGREVAVVSVQPADSPPVRIGDAPGSAWGRGEPWRACTSPEYRARHPGPESSSCSKGLRLQARSDKHPDSG